MRKEEFRAWLTDRIKKKPVGDCLSRCKAVEKALSVDLDEEYAKDAGQSVMSAMIYTAQDERDRKKAPDGFYFSNFSSIRYRMADMRCAVRRYFDFCSQSDK